MMGQQTRKESLFYYLRLEDQIARPDAPRLIRKSSCACCSSAISTGSPASGVYWKTCV